MVDWASDTSHMQHNDTCEQLPSLHQRLHGFPTAQQERLLMDGQDCDAISAPFGLLQLGWLSSA